jgi:hypothetical protein
MTAPTSISTPTQPRVGDRWRNVSNPDITAVVKTTFRRWDGTVSHVIVSVNGNREQMTAADLRTSYRLNRRA